MDALVDGDADVDNAEVTWSVHAEHEALEVAAVLAACSRLARDLALHGARTAELQVVRLDAAHEEFLHKKCTHTELKLLKNSTEIMKKLGRNYAQVQK